jgi:ketosteroid isomerase-like protein
MTTDEMSRRELLRKAVAGAVVGAAALVIPSLATAQTNDPESVQVVEIHQLQADFHLAKSTQNIDLMMSLWAADAVFTFKGVSYVGNDAIRALLLTTGSFTHKRLSLVSSFKIQIDVKGDQAYLYYECIDIGNFDTSPFVASVLFNEGTVRKIGGKWVFWQMNGGSALPLSVDHYYP